MSAQPTRTSRVASAGARVAILSRWGKSLDELDDARRDLIEAKLERHIQMVLDSAPPLTDEQRVRLGHLLTSGRAA